MPSRNWRASLENATRPRLSKLRGRRMTPSRFWFGLPSTWMILTRSVTSYSTGSWSYRSTRGSQFTWCRSGLRSACWLRWWLRKGVGEASPKSSRPSINRPRHRRPETWLLNGKTTPSSRGSTITKSLTGTPEKQAIYDEIAARSDLWLQLVEARQAGGLTQRELAQRLGVSQARWPGSRRAATRPTR